jgi:hypothetical protein
MLPYILYLIIAIVISIHFGRKRIIYFWWAFFFSFFFGLVFGISICLSSKKISDYPELYNDRNINQRIIYIIILVLICSFGLYYNFILIENDHNSIFKVAFKYNFLPQTILTGLIGTIIYELRAMTFSQTKSLSVNRQIDGLLVLIILAFFLISINPNIDFNTTTPSSPFR